MATKPPINIRLQAAFKKWCRKDIARFDRLWLPPEPEATGIKLALRRFHPHVAVDIDMTECRVVVMWDGATWDVLMTHDIAATQNDDGRWSIAAEMNEMLTGYTAIEQLWMAYLFEPMAIWIERRIMPAGVLYLLRVGDATWAELAARWSPPPVKARFAIFAANNR